MLSILYWSYIYSVALYSSITAGQQRVVGITRWSTIDILQDQSGKNDWSWNAYRYMDYRLVIALFVPR